MQPLGVGSQASVVPPPASAASNQAIQGSGGGMGVMATAPAPVATGIVSSGVYQQGTANIQSSIAGQVREGRGRGGGEEGRGGEGGEEGEGGRGGGGGGEGRRGRGGEAGWV